MRLRRLITLQIQNERQHLSQLSLRLKYANPQQKLNENRQRAAELMTALRRQMMQNLEKNRHRLALYIEKMRGLSPLQKLNQGYAYLENAEGKQIRSVAQSLLSITYWEILRIIKEFACRLIIVSIDLFSILGATLHGCSIEFTSIISPCIVVTSIFL